MTNYNYVGVQIVSADLSVFYIKNVSTVVSIIPPKNSYNFIQVLIAKANIANQAIAWQNNNLDKLFYVSAVSVTSASTTPAYAAMAADYATGNFWTLWVTGPLSVNVLGNAVVFNLDVTTSVNPRG